MSTLDTDEKVRSFEMFRQNLHNPEILTFDEVFERARLLVRQDKPAKGTGRGAGARSGVRT
jgi:hypothetical protein